jgi:LacI family transcriptional regulator
MLRQQRVAGLIIIPTRSDAEHGHRLRGEIHVPTVLLDMYVEDLAYDVVKLDNVEATRLATEHLIGLGHRRIAVLTGLKDLATSKDRLEGFLQAHRVAGISVDPALLLKGDYEQGLAAESVAAVMRSASPPTALLSISNRMTLGRCTRCTISGCVRRPISRSSASTISILPSCSIRRSPWCGCRWRRWRSARSKCCST